MKKICQQCGKEYDYTHHNDGTYKQYCCLQCKEIAKKLKEIEKNAPKKLICQHCSKEYIWENKGNWNKNNEQVIIKGKNHSNDVVDSKKYCCYECGKAHIREKVKATNLKRYGSENAMKAKCIKTRLKESLAKRTIEQKEETKKKRINTCLEKYGVEHISQSEPIKEKAKNALKNTYKQKGEEIKRKVEKTCLKRYGVTSTNKLESTKQKSKETCLKKYGVEFAGQSEQLRKKIEETNLKKYGVRIASCNKTIANKIKEKLSKKYKEEKETILSKVRQTCLEKYGVEYPCLREEARNKLTCISSVNKNFYNKLIRNNINAELEFSLKRYAYDIKIDTVFIEIDPIFTHNSSHDIMLGNYCVHPKSSTYHQEKSLYALNNGYHCIHLWDWDDEDKIIEMLKEKEALYARKLCIKVPTLEETALFLAQYHLQGSCMGQDIRFGLYKGDELVELMTFGKPRYNKKYQYELLRLCTKAGYKVIGGAEKLFNHFIKEYNPESVISYCDNSKFKGDVYKKLGMTLKDYGKPSKHWFNPITCRHITDNLLRQRGYSQLHKDKEHKKGENNEQLMLENGYLEIYDCGQSTYVWNKA